MATACSGKAGRYFPQDMPASRACEIRAPRFPPAAHRGQPWRMPMRLGLLVALCVLSAPYPARGGAWTLDAGTGQVVIAATPSSGDRVFDGARTLTSIPSYNKFELQGLIEYGATDWLTLILMPSLQHVDIAAPIDARRTGFDYTEFGGRAKLYEWDSWVFSMQATLRLPGTRDSGNPAAFGYTDTEADVRALVGKSFTIAALPAFIDLEAAQRFRTDGAPDEFHADVTLGIRPAAKWLLLAQSFAVVSQGAGTWGPPSYDYEKLQLSAVYQLTPAWALQFGGFTAFAGRNTLQENGIVLGAWLRF